MKLLLASLTALLLLSSCTDDRGGEGRFPGDCADGADNDGNGMFDCRDPGCAGAPACTDGTTPVADGGTPPGTDAASPPAGSAGTCCVNGVGYRCPTAAAMDRCAGPDPGACFDGCAFDDIGCLDGCNAMLSSFTPDPSGCTADPTVACEACRGTGSCVTDADCISSDHCMDDGRCYSGFAGCPCYPSVDDQCHNGCSLEGACQ